MALHPLTVHFPIALLYVAGVVYLLVLIKKDDPFYGRMAFLLHFIGTIAMVVAILSGRQALGDLVLTENLKEMSQTHELWGYGLCWFFAMLVVWKYLRPGRQKRLEPILFILCFWIGLGILAFQSHIGGEMVYLEGAGVEPMREILEGELKP